MRPGLLNLMDGAGEEAAYVTNGLKLHLDAGDLASFAAASNQNWDDLQGTFNWWRGGGSGSETSDPTFNAAGTPGAKTAAEYFSFDGGDYFSQQSAWSGLLPRTIGRQDRPFTVEIWIYKVAASLSYVFGHVDGSNSNQRGVGFHLDRTAGKQTLLSGPINLLLGTSATAMSNNAWHQIGFKGQHDGSTGHFILDGAEDGTWTGNNSGWTTGDSAFLATIGAGGTRTPLANGHRIAIVRMYDRVLSPAEIAQNWNADRPRFGL